ncbi:MAG: hypothetical protein KGS72_01115 [Cyanobacteria bacterium REEB67]|nr:hypothetical protein [Cyanobacteria bacterium REEB67]
MGGSIHGSDNVADKDFFNPCRNDIPTGMSSVQNDAYSDWKPAQHAGRANASDSVTIHTGDGRTIYAEAGSTINIYEGGNCDRRVGGGRNSYMPDYDNGQRDYSQRRQYSYVPNDNSGMYPAPRYENPQYRPVDATGYEVPYQQQSVGSGVGRFFGNLLSGLAVGAGVGLGERALGGYYRGYGGGYGAAMLAPAMLEGGYNNYNSNYNNYAYNGYYSQPPYFGSNYGNSYYPPPMGPVYGYGRHGGGSFIAGALTGAVLTSAINSGNRYQNYGNGYYS